MNKKEMSYYDDMYFDLKNMMLRTKIFVISDDDFDEEVKKAFCIFATLHSKNKYTIKQFEEIFFNDNKKKFIPELFQN